MPTCLPLAIIGVAASAVPGASPGSGEASGPAQGGQWWGLYLATTALMLICYAGVLRQQSGIAGARRPGLLDSLRAGLTCLPATFLLLLLSLVPLLPAGLRMALRGPDLAHSLDLISWLLLLGGLAALLFTFFAWPLLIVEQRSAWSALRESILLVSRHLRAVLALVGILLAALLVFSLLTGILLGLVMGLAGPEAQTGHAGLSFSRWLMAGLLALPVTYMNAVAVAAALAVRRTGGAAVDAGNVNRS